VRRIAGRGGTGAPYEAPRSPDVVVDGASGSPEAAARLVVEALVARGFLAPVDLTAAVSG
jgi:adenylylsulfate kinase-like enzyme